MGRTMLQLQIIFFMWFYDYGDATDQKKSKITPLAQSVKKLRLLTKNGDLRVV